MEYTSIYKNGKIQYFFISATDPAEWAFLQPYFLFTSIDKPRAGRIYELNKLFSNCLVWYGRQYHGYGYCASADVYGQFIEIIFKLYNNRLSENAKTELKKINTHDENIKLSENL